MSMMQNMNSQDPGPLMVSKTNPRYFTVASAPEQKAIYLTGSHIWHNFHDGMGPGAECSETPEEFDFDAYLKFFKDHGHNFIRLWRWEQFKSQAAGGGYHRSEERRVGKECNSRCEECHYKRDI